MSLFTDLHQHRDDQERWEETVAPVVRAVEELLPHAAVQVDAGANVLKVRWSGGVDSHQLTSRISDLVGKSPGSWHGGERPGEPEVVWWYGLGLEATRDVDPRALGYAGISALLAGSCTRCEDRYAEAGAGAFDEALSRTSPEELASHPNLAALQALGVQGEELEGLAELLGGMVETSSGESHRNATLEAACRHGHLEGLRALESMLRRR